MHVMVDGRCRGEPEVGPQGTWTEAGVENFCERAIVHAGMMKILGPFTRQFQGHIHGWAMLAESHVAVDLDRPHAYAWLELFSCRDFDSSGFVSLCRETFDLGNVRVEVLDRGLPRRDA